MSVVLGVVGNGIGEVVQATIPGAETRFACPPRHGTPNLNKQCNQCSPSPMSKYKKPKKQDLDMNVLSQINLNAAGIDIGADRHWVSVPVGRDQENIRSERLFY